MTDTQNIPEPSHQGDNDSSENTWTFELSAPGNLNPEKVTSLQENMTSESFEHFVRTLRGDCHPIGKTSLQLWEWISERLKLTKEEQGFEENISNFERNLYRHPFLRSGETKVGLLWFHKSWFLW